MSDDDLQDKLEQLHGSRRRAEERADERRRDGVFSADGTEEYDDLSAFERESSKGGDGGRADSVPVDGAGRGECVEPTPTDETEPSPAAERTRDEGRVETDLGAARYREHDYSDSHAYGEVELTWARRADVADLLETVEASNAWRKYNPEDLLYLDTETTGLAEDDYAFCIGLGRWQSDATFRVRHYFIESLDGERAMLAAVADQIRAHACLCTFNGARFDLPLLERRYGSCGLEAPFDAIAHLDLLKVSRTRRPGMESHSLDRMESHCLGHTRTDDLPGADVPKRWDTFQRSGRLEVLEDVFEHNRLDILAMVGLTAEFGTPAPVGRSGRSPESPSKAPLPSATSTTDPWPDETTPAGPSNLSVDRDGDTSASRSSNSPPRSSSVDTAEGESASSGGASTTSHPDLDAAADKLGWNTDGSSSSSWWSDSDGETDRGDVAERLSRAHDLREGRREGDESDAGEPPTADMPREPEASEANPPVSDPEPADEISDAPDESTPSDATSADDTDASSTAEVTSSDEAPEHPRRERLKTLRRRASELIEAGDREGALPLLHEIAALSPRHSYALEELATYHDEQGEEALAEHYRKRLREISPY